MFDKKAGLIFFLVVFLSSLLGADQLFAQGEVSFRARRDFGVGTVPQSVTVGDFNADGKPDLAVANYYSSNVSILLGNGDGTFRTAQNFAAGSNPQSVTVGDFNADDKPDLAVANYSSSNVSILLGNGDGTFRTAQNFAAGGRPTSVTIGDFNADGYPDLAVANHSSHNVSILVGNGDGTFRTAQNFAAGRNPLSITVGDFNVDDKPDVAVANYSSNNVSILLGNGDGTFRTAQNFAAGSNPQSITVGDFNADGKPDLAVANFISNNVSILMNDTPTMLPIAIMTGDQEVPPVDTSAFAAAAFVPTADRSAIYWLLLIQDLDPAMITGAHVHVGLAGQTGPVILRMTPLTFDEGLTFGVWTATDLEPGGGITTFTEAINALRAGRCYANIHTMAQPDGLVRGQINLVSIE